MTTETTSEILEKYGSVQSNARYSMYNDSPRIMARADTHIGGIGLVSRTLDDIEKEMPGNSTFHIPLDNFVKNGKMEKNIH